MSCKVQQSVCSDCVTYVKSRIKFNTFNTFNNVTYISVLIFISVLVHFFFYIFQLKINIIVQFVRLFQYTHIYKFNLVLSGDYNLGTEDIITDFKYDASFMVNSSVGQLFVFYFFEF